MIGKPKGQAGDYFYKKKHEDRTAPQPRILYKPDPGYAITAGDKVYGKKKSSHGSF